eukprot:TRINITY_DN674_c0_g1_i1.p2 TRINITY_DN674_c0_g1~~TRINITY_DN674_c0_g1_i1.p2  ORF type:complete len:396 (+),score=192.17 TRINITY_DN674_c0_g1_i1:71-1189(+)
MSAPIASALTSQDPNSIIHYLVTGTGYSRAIGEICSLGVPDILKKHGPQTAENLVKFITAEDSPTYSYCKGAPIPSFLQRTLRAAAQIGVVDEVTIDGEHAFAHNKVTETICSDSPLSIRWFFASQGGKNVTEMWELFGDTLRTGKSSCVLKGYPTCFEHLHEIHEEEVAFQRGMRDSLTPVLLAFPKQIDTSSFTKMTDIGGGIGHLLGSILEANQNLSGANYDTEAIINIALEHNKDHPVLGDKSRVEYIVGNYNEWIPKSDAYVMSRIIHDLNDERCIRLLTRIRESMVGDGRIFIVDIVMPKFGAERTHTNSFKFWFDILMMTACEASERNESQFAHILSESGLELVKITTLENSYMSVVEAKKKTVV